jgi:hypothetical protein
VLRDQSVVIPIPTERNVVVQLGFDDGER